MLLVRLLHAAEEPAPLQGEWCNPGVSSWEQLAERGAALTFQSDFCRDISGEQVALLMLIWGRTL